MKTKRAVTFVELLVAVSIFAVIMTSIYSAFYGGLQGWRRMNAAFERYQNVRMIFTRLELDLRNSFIYSDDDSGFIGSGSSLTFFAIKDLFLKGKTFVSPCKIKYDKGEEILKRTCFVGLDALKSDPIAQAEDLAENVKELTFQYANYNSNNTDDPYEWLDSWPTEDPQSKKELPLAVKVKISLIVKDKGRESESPVEFTRIISLPLANKVTPAASGGGGSTVPVTGGLPSGE